jgi:hypothetical protein
MNLHNKKGHYFRLDIVGYEFPEIVDRYWGSNILNVRVSGMNPLGSWNVEDSCLATFEVKQLAVWLSGLTKDKTLYPCMYFTEPSPQFRFIKLRHGKYLLRVDLAYIFRKKMPEVFGDRNTIRLYFPMTDHDLEHQAGLLLEQLKNYPQRVFR